MKADELQTLDTEELNSRLKGARRELYELRFKLAVGQLDDNRQIRKVRKDIARILTVVHARRLAMVPWGEQTEPSAMSEQAVEPAVSDGGVESSSKETPEDVEAARDEASGQPAGASRRPAPAGEEGTDD